jgi:GH15 family glucan-1,4-alpha-glucosidase
LLGREVGPPRRTFEVPSRSAYKPISGYGVIGNTRTVALVGYDGSVDWCCLPRFDSPSVFAALLDRKVGGKWVLAPTSVCTSSQRYLENTNILATRFASSGFSVELLDFMPCSVSADAWSAPPEIHRTVECLRGEVEMGMEIQPRFEYGKIVPRVESSGSGIAMKYEKGEMILASTQKLKVLRGAKGGSKFNLRRGERAVFVLSYGEYQPREVGEYRTPTQLLKTEVFWKNWVAGLTYSGPWRAQVVRSALVLKLLVYSPTGAMVAAPTTSLPESMGGERNWDYRYSWIRDSANSLWAFNILGNRSEAERYLNWLIDNNPALDLDLRLMYTIDVSTKIDEETLKHLEGYRGSRPVRVGNEAVNQMQMDAYGHMLDALYFSSRHDSPVSDDMYHRFVKPLAKYICDNWKKPGNGIWEFRNLEEHFVYTKAWCYAGLDRAVRIATAKGRSTDTASWQRVMKEIKREVLTKGWDRKKKSFVMHYVTDLLDSANLVLPLIGFIKANDPRMRSTIEATRVELGDGSLLRRYSMRDGLRGEEGSFVLCSFWLAACLARDARVDEAEKVFLDLLSYSNHLGLLSEEIDPRTGEALGNFPQAFSHMGLIIAAHEIEEALGRGRSRAR